MKFQPVREKESYVFRDDQSPKILRSMNNSILNATINDNNYRITRSDINIMKLTKTNQIWRHKKNNSSINSNDFPFIKKSNSSTGFFENEREQAFKKSQVHEYKKNYQKITNYIDKEYQNFLSDLYSSSQKHYNNILKDTLAKQKYKENERMREQKLQLLKIKTIQKSFENKL